jgi:alkylation response protein AidB-like acyl-CoA dehydrogenase
VRFTPQDEEYREQVRAWLAANFSGQEPLAWNRHLAAAGWTCLGWPAEHGGRGATLAQQVIFHEEYARAGAPPPVGIVGEQLLGPTLIAFGTPEQQQRFLPPIRQAGELWCQGYSEPGAGSDLAAVTTVAELEGDEWVITGHKIWTSLAHVADWCFVLARTEPGSSRSAGLSYLLVPMRQPGVTVRPIRQLTGDAEFNEVFFDGARTAAGNVVGQPGDGWRVARATLTFERGVAMLGRLVGFRREFGDLVSQEGPVTDPMLRDRLARAWTGLEVIRYYALDHATDAEGAQSSVLKVLWSRWHQEFGDLAMQARGARALVTRGDPYDLDDWQRIFLFGKAETIYGGSDEIQMGIIASRALGLPSERLPS